MSTARYRRRGARLAFGAVLGLLVWGFGPIATTAEAQWTNGFFGSSAGRGHWGRPAGTLSGGPSYYYGGTYDGYYFGHGYVGPHPNYAGTAYSGGAAYPAFSTYRPAGSGSSYGAAPRSSYGYGARAYRPPASYRGRGYVPSRYGTAPSYRPPAGYPMVALPH